MSLLDRALGNISSKTEISGDRSRDRLLWGYVVRVDIENLLMDVQVVSDRLTTVLKNIQINSSFTSEAFGLRVLPIPNESVVFIYEVNVQTYIHVGYHYGGVSKNLDNFAGTKENEAAIILRRNIESGEVQVVGLTNNEVYLSNDGSVLLKTQFGASLYLDNYMHRLEGVFANLKYEMDGVRLRAGNILRPVKEDTNEEDFIILNNDEVKKESDTEESEDENNLPLREFMVSVGTKISSETGVDEDPPLSPTVGYMALAEKVVSEKGEEIKVLDKSLNYRLKLTSGFSLAIDNEGSLYLLDDTNGSFTKFGVGENPDKSIRSGDSLFLMNTDDGIYIKHSSGSTMQMDKDGNIQFSDKSKNSILMQDKGITINSPDGDVNIVAKKIILSPESSVFIGDSNSATDTVLTAGGFATVYDVHKHTGPVGPVNPADQLSNTVNAQNSSAKGISVT